MDKQVVTLVKGDDKKHSVVYRAVGEDQAVTSVYIMRRNLGKPVPQKLIMTLEEA